MFERMPAVMHLFVCACICVCMYTCTHVHPHALIHVDMQVCVCVMFGAAFDFACVHMHLCTLRIYDAHVYLMYV